MARAGVYGSFNVIWALPVMIMVMFGGVIQYFGLITQTQSAWIVIGLLFANLLFLSNMRQARHEILLLPLLLLILVSALYISSPVSYTLTYIYYLICAFVAAVSGRTYALQLHSQFSGTVIMRAINVFLFLELFTVVLQRIYTGQFISYARVPIGFTDAIFGTLFLQSDAVLAAICEIACVICMAMTTSVRTRLSTFILAYSIVFLGNSNAAMVALFVITVILALNAVYRNLSGGKVPFNFLACGTIMIMGYVSFTSLYEFFDSFLYQASRDYYRADSMELASRFAPFGQMLSNELSLFGDGALTYYNPITKQWLYNAGFSTVYSLYIDFGLVGLASYMFYQFAVIVRFSRSYLDIIVQVVIFGSFAQFNFALSDVTFVFFFNLGLGLSYLQRYFKDGLQHPRPIPSVSSPNPVPILDLRTP